MNIFLTDLPSKASWDTQGPRSENCQGMERPLYSFLCTSRLECFREEAQMNFSLSPLWPLCSFQFGSLFISFPHGQPPKLEASASHPQGYHRSPCHHTLPILSLSLMYFLCALLLSLVTSSFDLSSQCPLCSLSVLPPLLSLTHSILSSHFSFQGAELICWKSLEIYMMKFKHFSV